MLLQAKRLNSSNKHIVRDLLALAAFLRECPSLGNEFLENPDYERLIAVIKDLATSSNTSIMCAAIRAWTSACLTIAKRCSESQSSSNKGNIESAIIAPDVSDLLSQLFSCLANDCLSFLGIVIDDSKRSVLRETVGLCLFDLLRARGIGLTLKVKEWHLLAWTLLDPSPSVKFKLTQSLNTLIQTHAVHPRILALSCLLATDAALCASAESALNFAVKRLRRTHQLLCEKAMNSQDHSLRKVAEDNMPETILPYVLHLLSHHPDFPTSAAMDDEQDRLRMKAVMQSLSMVLNVLLDSVNNTGENLSYLFKQVLMITQYYTDRVDPGNLGLSFVTRLTRKMLNERIRAAENVQTYPGDIMLPMDLYAPCEDDDPDEGLETEEAVDIALRKVGNIKVTRKRRIDRSPSAVQKTLVRKREEKRRVRARVQVNSSDEDSVEDRSTRSLADARSPVDTQYGKISRSGRAIKAVQYHEVDEDDQEVNRWDETAGLKAKSRSRPQHNVDSLDQENSFAVAIKSSTKKEKVKKVIFVSLEYA